MDTDCDIIVVGGGIAGASIAAHLSAHASVRLLEMESQPGYHTTGRSAALFSETYGNGVIRALTRASSTFFHRPPETFSDIPLLRSRPVLVTARKGQDAALESYIRDTTAEDEVDAISCAQAVEACPILRSETLIGALLCRRTADVEVHELHQGYLRMLKAQGGRITTDARVTQIRRDGAGWTLEASGERFSSALIVNAAGAWADGVGALAGAIPIQLTPLRRTALLVPPPPGVVVSDWPMLLDVEEQFYLKPDAGMLLLSPADETPSEPCDAQPEELDVAIAVARLEEATTLEVKRLGRRWAGLRSFVADRSPVVGFDPKQPAFFWLAGLGGYGIQTAPALSRLASALALRMSPDEIPDGPAIAAAISPERLVAA